MLAKLMQHKLQQREGSPQQRAHSRQAVLPLPLSLQLPRGSDMPVFGENGSMIWPIFQMLRKAQAAPTVQALLRGQQARKEVGVHLSATALQASMRGMAVSLPFATLSSDLVEL